jgi:isoleucyl-tRNA synthetase
MSKTRLFQPVTPDVQLPAEELKTLEFWDQRQIFAKSVEQNKGNEPYSFYDGPPFATGLPHYGHLLAGTIKDIVPRYWTMQGRSVPRRFGWDCHGVPVEFEINKSLGLQSRKDILNYGVAKYNAACRSIVNRYAHEWKRTVHRMGRWIDMDHPYFTMDVEFMQSVWTVFKRLFEMGLIYEGYKVVPYSTGISTPLSNFEANLNYKDVQDPAVTISFPLVDDPSAAFLAWTTTPWTLPSNLGLAVHRDVDYARVADKKAGRSYWVASALASSLFDLKPGAFEVAETLAGARLVGLEFVPPFDFFESERARGAFRVIHSDHVTTASGTGIVHMAPAFGEDDFYACQKAGLPLVNPVDDDGQFTAEVPLFAGMRVKDADKEIIKSLKERGALFKHDTLVHSYPFCYRSDQPLIYRAVSSWFVAVEKIKDDVVAANKATRWVPDHLRDGRFGNWLENARDWAISRNRFWGTPIPIWKNAEGEILCVGSRDELERLSGKKVEDLHKEYVDEIEIPSPTGKSPLRRVDSVLDCWFESGSMPYAQWGYPFKNQEMFEKGFPADFIAEGLDQTRGWFYTLTVIGAALYKKAPFKNVVVNGMVLAEDGKKMSKSLRNYPDPEAVIGQHGADAVRLYMIDSPVVKAQELRFSDKGVRDIVRRIMLRWWNAYSFFVNYANIDGFEPRGDFARSPNVLDQYILSRLDGLIAVARAEMGAYRLYNVVPALLAFVEDLTNSYIRFNRSHFWQEEMSEEKRYAFETLFHILATLSKCMAPFAPFLSETIWRNLSAAIPGARESVHLELYPEVDARLRRPDLEAGVKRMEAMVTLARNYREKISVKAKIPLRLMRVIHREPSALDELRKLEPYFAEEINVQRVEYRSDEDHFVDVGAKANFPALGKRLGPKMKAVASGIQALKLADLLRLEAGETLHIEGEAITLAEVEIRRVAKQGNANLMASQLISIEFDPTVTPQQAEEGAARSVLRKVQLARRAAGLNFDDRIHLQLALPDELKAAALAHLETIKREALALRCEFVSACSGEHVEKADVDGEEIAIGIRKA